MQPVHLTIPREDVSQVVRRRMQRYTRKFAADRNVLCLDTVDQRFFQVDASTDHPLAKLQRRSKAVQIAAWRS